VYWLVVTLGIALVAVPVTRGRFRQLGRLRIQSWWLLVLGLGVQVALELVEVSADRIDDIGLGLLMFSYALILAFCFLNLRVPAMAIVTIGVAMNATVIGLNEGMPTRDQTIETQTGREVERPVARTVQERPESDDDLLPVLGQVVPVPDNPIDEALSPGDLVIAAGVIGVFIAGSRRRRPEATPESAPELDTEPVPVIEPEPVSEVAADSEPQPERTHAPPPPAAPLEPEPRPEPAHPAADEWEAWRKELQSLAGDLDDDREE
jgi:hypothetical protein